MIIAAIIMTGLFLIFKYAPPTLTFHHVHSQRSEIIGQDGLPINQNDLEELIQARQREEPVDVAQIFQSVLHEFNGGGAVK